MTNPLTTDEINRIRILRLQGLTMHQIAKKINRYPSCVLRYLTKLGLNTKIDLYSDDELEQIRLLHSQGLNLHEIAEQLNRSVSSIFNREKKMGLDTKCNYNHSVGGKRAWKTRIEKYGLNGCTKDGFQKKVVAARKLFLSERNPSYREDVMQKIRLAQKGVPCPQRDPNPEKRIKASMKALHIRPNKPETELNILLQQLFPNEYKFVGDGSFLIERKCPDFVNVNGKKKIIELFGRVFHNPKKSFFKIPYERTEQGRIELFKKNGFDTLIVWDSELDNVPVLSEKLMGFHNGDEV